LLDRIDLQVDLMPVSSSEIGALAEGERSADVAIRIDDVRKIQRERFKGRNFFCNSEMTDRDVQVYCRLDDQSRLYLKKIVDKHHVSGRGYNRVLKLARTIADMSASTTIKMSHVAEAVQYRCVSS
jgi:magnesium chelatase family protein